MDITLEDLKLEDLFATLPPAKSEKAPPEAPEQFWYPTSRVLVIQRTLCLCGAMFEAPGAKTLLTRFVNKRNMDIQELSQSHADAALPISTRTLICQVSVCQKCVK